MTEPEPDDAEVQAEIMSRVHPEQWESVSRIYQLLAAPDPESKEDDAPRAD